jgi:ligand-binding SRPBCC domain-containing protein
LSYTLQCEQWVPRPLDEVFAFFSDARNLEILTPAWLNFKILTPGPITVATGTHIQYRLSWHGVPLRWTTEITRWNPPVDFEDIQLSGPYKLWRHTHRFRAHNGGTQMTDTVEYTLPLGLLGRVAHAVQVRRNLEKIFDYRYERIREVFGEENLATDERR